ncbi:hypothetical protein RX327_31120 [Bradyrhizobium sp. BEA-2-5]|uniref:hypothetical protein n=1 Tax=Bradyrhizobium sp. BEA-2-5 TaxID=3080015 RepID=UPI00293E007C|nr:hypothetical protein [Bradyrhizobium sp. BEA-2-5]WOH80234.1 hypothetical protein RX327_31120 [Bradyrhizobium sp. BEA-2-5]
MDVPSDRMSCIHASKLRHVKDLRECSARSELSNMDAKRNIAVLAAKRAWRELIIAEEHHARAEREVYKQLVSLGTLSVIELDRSQLTLEKLAGEIASKRQTLEDARIAQGQAEIAASEKRVHWVKRSAASHKWRQIETDVRRAAHDQSEVTAEIDADDEVLLRYGQRLLTKVADGSI